MSLGGAASDGGAVPTDPEVDACTLQAQSSIKAASEAVRFTIAAERTPTSRFFRCALRTRSYTAFHG